MHIVDTLQHGQTHLCIYIITTITRTKQQYTAPFIGMDAGFSQLTKSYLRQSTMGTYGYGYSAVQQFEYYATSLNKNGDLQ
jgi:hypothetical protein